MYRYDDPDYPYSNPVKRLTDLLKTQNPNPQEHEIFFLNPVFHNGLNITVRNGVKWAEVSLGDTLLLKKTDENQVIKTATVFAKATLPFEHIPADWLKYDHDPECRTLEGLLEHGMKPAYPGFNGDELVTVLTFYVQA